MADGTVRGEFVWHDLLTPNAAGAHEFYKKAVGWKTQPWERDSSYVMFAAPSGPIGGVTEARAATPHWVSYISTSDVDATTEAATRLGARVQTPPTPLPNGGRFALLFDPQGAAFGIYASDSDDAAPTAPRAGEFSWHELATNAVPSIAFAFYQALFGWDEISQHDMGPMGMYLIFGRNGRQLGGIFDKGATGKPGSAYWLGYVSVTDLEGTVERATAARGSVLTGPMDVPGGDRIAQLMDPYGAFFALHMRAGTQAAKPAKAPKVATAKKPPASKPAAKPLPARKAAVKKAAPKKAVAKKPAPRKATKKKPPPKKKAAKKAAPRKAAKKKAKGKPKKK